MAAWAISFHMASEILPRIGAVEGLIAEREIRHDVAFDRRLQKGPLEPGRIARVTAVGGPSFETRALRAPQNEGEDGRGKLLKWPGIGRTL